MTNIMAEPSGHNIVTKENEKVLCVENENIQLTNFKFQNVFFVPPTICFTL